MNRSQLVNAALQQIVNDVESGDLTAVEELISSISDEFLAGFLSEGTEYDDEEYDEEYDGQPDEAQEWYDFDPEC
jgi:hypothetical protein